MKDKKMKDKKMKDKKMEAKKTVLDSREEKLKFFVSQLCHFAGEDERFFADFWSRLSEYEDVKEELSCYMEHGSFACKAKAAGYTAVDLMVWQMDHFKARLDRDNSGMRQNGDRMLLFAFDTLLKMKENPDKYLRKLQEETGTDYPGKY